MRANLDQRCRSARFRQPLPQHVRGRHARPVERLLAIGGGGAAHVSFHVGQARDNACNCRRASTTSRRSGLWPGSSEPLSSAAKDSRYPETSADECFPWAAETARRERHRRRAKCSRRNGPRCTNSPPDPPPRAAWEGRRTLPGCRPARDCGRLSGSSSPGMRSARTDSVAVHHGRDGGIERVMHAQFGGQFLHAGTDRQRFAVISTLAMVTRSPVRAESEWP